MKVIDFIRDPNFNKGTAVQVGDKYHWILVDGSDISFDQFDAQQTATAIASINDWMHNAENRMIHVIQTHNIPIGTVDVHEYLSDDEEIKQYLIDKKVCDNWGPIRQYLMDVWMEKYNEEYVIRGYEGK